MPVKIHKDGLIFAVGPNRVIVLLEVNYSDRVNGEKETERLLVIPFKTKSLKTYVVARSFSKKVEGCITFKELMV